MIFPVNILEENHKKKFAVLLYRDYLKLVELAADESNYKKAIKVLQNRSDPVLDYDTSLVINNPIAQRRKMAGLSQTQLAGKMKVTPSYISRIEKPGANPSKATLLKIAKALDCDIEELL